VVYIYKLLFFIPEFTKHIENAYTIENKSLYTKPWIYNANNDVTTR